METIYRNLGIFNKSQAYGAMVDLYNQRIETENNVFGNVMASFIVDGGDTILGGNLLITNNINIGGGINILPTITTVIHCR